MNVSVLASGSGGNCVYAESAEGAILIDAGITRRQIARSLSAIGKDLKEVDAVLLTHEHFDHVKGLPQLQRRDRLPVYCTRKTAAAAGLATSFHTLTSRQSFFVSGFQATPLPVSHDAAEPVGFRLKAGARVAGVFTDLGQPSAEVRSVLAEADLMVLESNHDVDMLLNGPYPEHLKARILGSRGHLSNIDAGSLAAEAGAGGLRRLVLAHLSQKNNTAERALETVRALTAENRSFRAETLVAGQDEPTELFRV